ncbi:hypothetical protein RFI_34817 [Reticulomyxa filosa]|uniref:Uncharacterized protein n=1 Tax=Reticulomyxa filosa TaxID=46433 RepID=X6LKX0_RETFI|nr:hypothetical protein RFI_34817 [Reticulomyxa filosa]|eukprot:ETO02598.1 hypothetical protein RFI_34817 [Reticulomyxa filosa]
MCFFSPCPFYLFIKNMFRKDYDRLRPLSYPGTDVILLVFSLNDEDSLRNITDKWYPEVIHYLPDATVLLVGNKSDLRTQDKHKDKAVRWFDATQVSKEIKAIKYVECSAKTQENLQSIFEFAIDHVIKQKTTKYNGRLSKPNKHNNQYSITNINEKFVVKRCEIL